MIWHYVAQNMRKIRAKYAVEENVKKIKATISIASPQHSVYHEYWTYWEGYNRQFVHETSQYC